MKQTAKQLKMIDQLLRWKDSYKNDSRMTRNAQRIAIYQNLARVCEQVMQQVVEPKHGRSIPDANEVVDIVDRVKSECGCAIPEWAQRQYDAIIDVTQPYFVGN